MLILAQGLLRICSVFLITLLFLYLPWLPNVISDPIHDASIPRSRYFGEQQQLPCTEDHIEENLSERKNDERRKMLGNYFDTV